MIPGWILRGMRTGVVTTRYPDAPEPQPAGVRNHLVLDAERCAPGTHGECAAACPTPALRIADRGLTIDLAHCIQCGHCVDVCPTQALSFSPDYELAVRNPNDLVTRMQETPQADNDEMMRVQRGLLETSRAFRRSLHIRHVDAGSDGSAESEILALANPYYDLQRLGFFFTASPRHADIVMVTGAVTAAMAGPLRATVMATPEPRAVVAVGTSACGGGIEADPEVRGGVDRVVPVDVYVPGDPPSPLILLHALLLAAGRVQQRLQHAVVAAHGTPRGE